jgi:hypothetical protein
VIVVPSSASKDNFVILVHAAAVRQFWVVFGLVQVLDQKFDNRSLIFREIDLAFSRLLSCSH